MNQLIMLNENKLTYIMLNESKCFYVSFFVDLKGIPQKWDPRPGTQDPGPGTWDP